MKMLSYDYALSRSLTQMNDERCEICRFWKIIDSSSQSLMTPGLCRRYPPSPGEDQPVVKGNIWCGEWKAVKQKKNKKEKKEKREKEEKIPTKSEV
jgi:hypothetical protein